MTEHFARRLSRRWSGLASPHRRRIVLGALFGLALAARDVILLTVASSLLLLSEMAPSPQPRLPQPSA